MKIALTYTGSELKHVYYESWLKGTEDISVCRLSAEQDNLQELDQCDALVLSGGVDIHPRLYHQGTHYAHMPDLFRTDRDEFEREAFRLALEKEKPVLAICRGMQLVNCALGGDLHQDLGELNRIHKAEGKDKAHALDILEGTRLSVMAGAGRAVVNSAHHQAVNRTGAGLRINCISDDGIIEGLEWNNPSQKPFLLCVQWHPERMGSLMLQDSPLSLSIRSSFLEEIKKSILKK